MRYIFWVCKLEKYIGSYYSSSSFRTPATLVLIQGLVCGHSSVTLIAGEGKRTRIHFPFGIPVAAFSGFMFPRPVHLHCRFIGEVQVTGWALHHWDHCK